MKHIRITFVSLLALLLTFNPIAAQDNRTLDTKVADLLVQVPADDQQKLNEQMQTMLSLEETGLQKIMDLVIPPGTGDDTRARVAIESLSRYLSQAGMETEQKNWESLILKQIENKDDLYVKRFFIRQLNYFGSDAAIERLKSYLADPDLQDPVIRAIRDINPAAAPDLFVSQLNSCEGRLQIALVNAIANTGNGSHAEAISKLAGSSSLELQRSVLACLAKLGNPASYGTLNDAAKNAAYKPESTRATGSLIVYAGSLSNQGQHELSLKICKNLIKKCKDPDQLHFKSAALVTAADNDQIEQALPLLVGAMKDGNKIYRMAAISYAADHNTPVEPWLAALSSSKNNEAKSEILYLFGVLESQETIETVTSYLNDPDAGVRQEAVKSLALIEKGEAVPAILSYTTSYPATPDSKTAREVLLQTVGTEQLPLLKEEMEAAPEGAKIVFTEVIAARRDYSSFGLLYDQTSEPGALRSASIKNLYLISGQENLEDLMTLFDRLDDEKEMSSLEKALLASINNSPRKDGATEMLLSHAAASSAPERYIGVLAGVGGKEALDAVYNTYNNGDEKSRKKAFEGLRKSDDIHAAAHLFSICSLSGDTLERDAAYRSYIRTVSSSALPDDQKLLLLRKIEGMASDDKARVQLIRAMGGVKTFLSFVCLSRHLDNEALQTDAANALVRVVLPSNGMDNGLEGKLVKKQLKKARDIITGPDTEYLKIDIQNYLDKMPEETGFVSMFNGTDLTGWQGLAADPLKKAELSSEALQKLQDEANGKVKDNWSIKDQCIVFNGDGSNLCSVRQYGSFEMIVDWRITKKGDSGIYLRGSPQVQIWDTTRVDVGAQVGSGGLYNNQEHESIPLVVADNPIGDWNTFRIVMIGERVSVWLNGQLVVDNVIMENYWDRSIPIFPTGSIELQAHGTDLAFRDIYVRELNEDVNSLTEEEKTEGFVSLFNGRDLSNWAGNEHSYSVEEGTIVIRPAKSGGNLYTAKEYSDFVFRFEFKLTPGANNGLGIRTPMEGDAAYVGYELQILDNTAPVYAELQPYQYHGSVYGIIPAKRGFLKPVGEWNSQEVYVNGDKIRITLNGTVIVDGDLKESSKNGTADHREHPGLERSSGHIGFLGHGSLLWFRNIRIKEL